MLRVGSYRLNDHSSACVAELQQWCRGALLALLFVEQRARAAPPVFACCVCNADVCQRGAALRCIVTLVFVLFPNAGKQLK